MCSRKKDCRAEPRHAAGLLIALGVLLLGSGGARAEPALIAPFAVEGDAVVAPLDGKRGDASRGRRIVLDRETGNCLICHKVPEPGERFQGDLGPDLGGVGSRFTVGQLRLRVIDQRRLNPASIMPPYHRVDGTVRVGTRWRGRPVLDAQAVEDVVAWLSSLKE